MREEQGVGEGGEDRKKKERKRRDLGSGWGEERIGRREKGRGETGRVRGENRTKKGRGEERLHGERDEERKENETRRVEGQSIGRRKKGRKEEKLGDGVRGTG